MVVALDGRFPVIGTRTRVPVKMPLIDPKTQRYDFKTLGGPEQQFSSPALTDHRVRWLKETHSEMPLVFQDPLDAIEDYQDVIVLHMERRIQLFFEQAILCYGQPFVFDAKGADDQYGAGTTFSKDGYELQTVGAHPSTLPCLHAYEKDEDGLRIEKTRFVFLKHSSSYEQHNATDEVPIAVNHADSLIDKEFRAQALRLINRLADKRLTPDKAIFKFMKKLAEHIESLIETLDEEAPKRRVLEIYLDTIRDKEQGFEESKADFDMMMGVKVEGAADEDVLRDVVYRKRYTLLQEVELIESKIAQRIMKAQNKIFGQKAKKLSRVNNALRYALIKKSGDERHERCLEKLFCTSVATIDAHNQRLRKGFSPRFVGDTNKIKDKATEFDNLQRDLRALFRELDAMEMNFRSHLFKGIRVQYKEWTGAEFVAAFKALYPNESMSRPMVSRIEQATRLNLRQYKTPLSQRKKGIDLAKAQKIAKAYGVDVGLFLPALASSNY